MLLWDARGRRDEKLREDASMRALVLALLLTLGAGAQDTKHYLWIMPTGSGKTSLEADSSGWVRETPARQQENRCWRLVPASNHKFHIVCAAFGERRGLALKQGKPYLAADRGAAWELRELEASRFTLKCAQGALGEDWTLWSRQALGRRPEAGNFVRSDRDLWKVVVNGLRGRAAPRSSAPVVTTFRKDTVLRPDHGRGGSDEVFWNEVDEDGNTWIRVSNRDGKPLNCYVRANSRWLRPL